MWPFNKKSKKEISMEKNFTYTSGPNHMKIEGKNPDFYAIFCCQRQEYTVYYKNKVLVDRKYKFSQVESYLN